LLAEVFAQCYIILLALISFFSYHAPYGATYP
jgi:hypothetical protein